MLKVFYGADNELQSEVGNPVSLFDKI